ncbi:hypothetical protein IH879_21040, partial [candidate division KSB1 bacterium]|nr:hypothetical protein [candidate division KSB1 bacterium]
MNRTLKRFFVIFSVVMTGCSSDFPVTADLVLINAKIWTVDKTTPQAEAVAIWQEKILAVGGTAELRSLIGP